MPQQQSKEKREQMRAKSAPVPARKSPAASIATPKAPAALPATAQPEAPTVSGLGDLAKANKAARAKSAPPATSNDATVAAQKKKERR